MEMNIPIVMRKFGAIHLLLVSALAARLLLSISCAPSHQVAAATTPATSATTPSPASSSKSLQASTTAKPPSTSTSSNAASHLFSPIASELSNMPSLVNLRHGVKFVAGPAVGPSDELNTFDGRNPFTDDSLWQIPVHLVRDLSASDGSSSSQDLMAKSASEMSLADGDDVLSANENDGPISSLAPGAGGGSPATVTLSQSSSSSPTIISASTDLKTAAGYHHPTHGYHGQGHHGYGGGHHDSGHYGGDHYGKYFQYASVPYPYAWDFGYRRGNPYHTIERYEHGKGPHFQTKVKWADKHGGYGVHVWDYNHDDHHSHHYGGGRHDSYGPSHYGGGHHGSSHHGGHYGHH